MIPGLIVEVVSLFNDFGSAVEFLAGGHPIGEPLGDLDIAPTALVGDQAPDPTDARAGKEHPLAIAGLALQVVQHRVHLGRGQPLRLGHRLASVSERPGSPAAGARRAMNLKKPSCPRGLPQRMDRPRRPRSNYPAAASSSRDASISSKSISTSTPTRRRPDRSS